MTKSSHMKLSFLAVFLALFSIESVAYDINGDKWPGGETTIFVGIPGVSASGIPWSVAMHQAAQEWNASTSFNFNTDIAYKDPCIGYSTSGSNEKFPLGSGDNLNGADFSTTVCGSGFNDSTLAITLQFTESNSLGARDIVEADIVFNGNRNFDIYDGPINLQQFAGVDFRRVALHELGHVLGLGHDQHSPPRAIMAPNIGSFFSLQPDDIEGANFLYAGVNNCKVVPLRFGTFTQSLGEGDCRVQELMSGGTDTSFVDVYSLELTEAARITIEMKASSLDSVLLLADTKLKILEIDDDGGEGCDARIRQILEPGSYIILANTYVSATACGTNTGTYQFTLSYDTSAIRTLSGKESFQGGLSASVFKGGVTLNKGFSFTNRVTPTQQFDVSARIEIEPKHRNQPGFIVVAALLDDGSILVKNPAGDFVPYNPQLALIPIASSKVLGVTENIVVLANTVAQQMGLENIVVDFLVGYGVDSAPNELYFHAEPINLIVAP